METITADASGHGHTGTLTNGPTWVAGQHGNALSFNASDDGNDSNDPRVVIGPNLNIPPPPFTVSVWVRPADYADWRAILSKRDSGAPSNRRFDWGLATSSGRVYATTGASTRTFLYAVPINVWTHLAVVVEAGATRLYVNGNLQETLAAIALGPDTLANTVIGGTGEGAGGDNDPFKGSLDDLRLHDRALSLSEVQSDMNTPVGPPDTEAPSVSLTAPAEGAVVSGAAASVTASASDNIGVAGVQFQLDGADLGAEDTVAPYAISWNTVPATVGPHTLTAVARDGSGNTTMSAAVNVTVSNPPSLSITQPADGATLVGTTVIVSYTASGDLAGVDHAHFILDGAQSMDLTLDGTYQFNNVSAGPHVLDGFLVDADHNKVPGTDAETVSFTTAVADTIPPTVSITSPAASSTVSATVTITASASDNTGVLGVRFRVGAVDLNPEDTSAPFTASFNTTTFANGSYVLTAVARDGAGNQTTSAGVPVTVSNVGANDPAVVGQWSAVLSMPLVAVHMTLMSDGNILAWDDHTTDGGSHVWNPASHTFTMATYNVANLFCSGHTALADGRILVNGGHYSSYVGLNTSALFTPSTGAWQAGPAMQYARWYPSTITLPDGRALTVSGAINCPDCRLPGYPDPGVAEVPEIYDPATNDWIQLNAAAKYFPLYPHLYLLPDGRVVAATTQEDPIVTTVLDLGTQTWTTVDSALVDGGCSVMYLPGKIMKSGAAINSAYPTAPSNELTHVLDMTTTPAAWRQTASMAYQRTQHNLTLLPDGNVLVTGGSRNSDRYDQAAGVLEAELWSPETETYATMARMVTPRLYHSTAILLPDGRVAAAGGGRPGSNKLNTEIYSPPYLFKGPRPQITAAPATNGYASNFTVTTLQAGSIAKVSLLRLGSVTHAMNSEQRFVPLVFTSEGGGLSVQPPWGPTIAPPGFYLLFIVDSNGVPSVAATVQIPVSALTGVEPSPPAPEAALRVFPNPFRGGTGIEAARGRDIAVYDVSGRLVRRWRADRASPTGSRHVQWDGTDRRGRRLPAGIYFVKAGDRIVRAALLR